MNTYKISAYESSVGYSGMRDFMIEALTAADAVTIFEYRHRRRSQRIDFDHEDQPMIPTLSEPHDITTISERL